MISATDSRGTFSGAAYVPRLDRARLFHQIERIRAFALARDWFTLREAREELERLYSPVIFPEASLSAQLRNLEKPAAGRLRCKKEKRRRTGAGKGVWEYRLRAVPAEFLSAPAALVGEAPPKKIKWPATFDELEEASYGYTGRAKECECGKIFQWWITPRGKWLACQLDRGFAARASPFRLRERQAAPSHCDLGPSSALANRTVLKSIASLVMLDSWNHAADSRVTSRANRRHNRRISFSL